LFEPSQKITSRSGIRDYFGSQRVEVSLIVSSQFDILKAGTTGKNIVCDV
jgi:hypothetical protein